MHAVVELFKALGHETRLRILCLLLDGEVCVCQIMNILQLPQSTASRQLAILKQAGLVVDRRSGIWVHYSLAAAPNPLAATVLTGLAAQLPQDEICTHDRRRLAEALAQTARKG